MVAAYADAGVDELILPDFTGEGDELTAMDRFITEVAKR